MTPRRIARLLVAGLTLVAALAWASPAMSQEPDSEPPTPTKADIGFVVGAYEPGIHDWTVTAVLVSGDLEDGKDFTVEVRGPSDRLLWSATTPFHSPQTRIEVDRTIGVADVASASISQAGTVVDAASGVDPKLVPSQVVDPVQGGGGSSGQVATSMVLVIIVAVILFRTPLPAASTQRWTK